MVKKILLLSAVFIASGILFNSTPTISNNNTPPLGRTAAPGEPSTACAQSGCHTGNLNAGSADLIINFSGSDNSYQAGQTYNMSLTINGTGTRFGFEMVALNAAGQSVGTFTGSASNQTQVTTGTTGPAAGRQYIHHLGAANHGNNNTYSFTWTAPTSDQGNITFYASGNAANSNNGATGDKVYTNSRSISFNTGIGIEGASGADSPISIAPNPSKGTFTISYTLTEPDKLIGYIYDLKGALLKTIYFAEQTPGQYIQTVDLNDEQLIVGIYLLQMVGKNSQKTTKIVLK